MSSKSKGSALQVAKKDPYRGFSLYVRGLSGVNTALAANAIEDNECQAIWNLLPIGKNLMRKIKAPLLYSTCPHNIQAFYNDVLGSTLVMFVILSDGSAGTIASDGTYTEATGAAAGTFNNTGVAIDITNWQNTVLLITDATKGYFKYTLSTNTVTLISASLNGNAIAVWQGRVLLSQGRVLNYSGPLDYTFGGGTGAGYLTISSTNLRQSIERIIPYMDSVSIVGDHAIIALTGTTISSDPTTWYQMEVFNSLGSIYPSAVTNFMNNLYLNNEYGAYRVASTQEAKVDVVLDDSAFTWLNYRADIAQINNLNFWLTPASATSPILGSTRKFLLAYCVELQVFTFLDLGFDVNGVFTTRAISDHSLYAWSDNKVYKLFAGTGAMEIYVKSKIFDFGYPYIFKFVRFVNIDYRLISGVPDFTIDIETGVANNTVQ